MSRYYHGDIQGQFWFGVQDSDDATFFGGQETVLTTIEYYFDDGDVLSIKEGLQECREELGDKVSALDEFFWGGRIV